MHVTVFGPLRLGPLSVGEPWRALIVLLALGGLRHARVRTPSLAQRLWAGLTVRWCSEAFQAVWPIVLVTRLSVLLVGYLAVVSIGYPEGAPPIRVSDNEA
ncbi:MAG: hypothetical protein O3A25_08950 [Acidobacteria bacterium]|nr:hypothetical protein [Acidobacteriota bacterium]